MSDLTLGWGGACPQALYMPHCPTPDPSPEGEGGKKA